MAIKDVSNGRTDLYKLDPRILKIKPNWNNRDFTTPENIAHVEELSLSIAQNGVKKAIEVEWKDNEPYIVDGESRYRACMLAIERGIDIKSVPVVLTDKYANEADKLFVQIIGNSGKPFTQLEQAKVFKKLLDLGWSQNDIATKSGKTAGRVSQILELLTLPEIVKTMVANGEVSASMAMQTVKSEGEKEAAKKLSTAVEAAKTEGKKRAMPKHVGERGPSPLKVVKSVIEDAFADNRYDDSEETVTISFPEADWQKILTALKL